ncbi:MAG: GDP-mannose 4,6-dehydratase [Chitinophagaceae bacterium]|nr:GDP-mannose 4,6-dehydratase [Chitinophagaceae bacterium]
MSKAILITGAAGFIGSHLCEALVSSGQNVIGIDNFDPTYCKELKRLNLANLHSKKNFTFIEEDITNITNLSNLGEISVVIHLAAKAGVQPSITNPQSYIHSNISVTNSLLEWMKDKEITKLIFASSSSVYGNATEIPFKEFQNTDISYSPYAFTKKACEVMNYTYHSLYNIDIINLRLFTVYGERQRPDLAIHKFTNCIFHNRPILMYGEGDTARDYTYVSDTIQGIKSALEYINSNTGVYETINLGNSKPVTLSSLINIISEVTNIKPNIIRVHKKPGDVDITYADIEHATRLLNYSPKTDLKTGITNFVKWYCENILNTYSSC